MSDQRLNTVSNRELLDIDREAVIAQRDIDRLTTELAAARGVKAGVFRRAKKAGADMDAYRGVIKLRAMDVDDRNKLRETEEHYAAVLGVVLYRAGTAEAPQGALWDEETKEAKTLQREALIASDGIDSARGGGETSDNPHTPGTRDYQVWAEGFSEGKAELGGKQVAKVAKGTPRKTAKAAKPATAAVGAKPRGRPKKSAAASALN